MHKSRIHPSNLSKTKGIWENGAESTNVVILGYSLISVAALRIYIDSPLSKKTKNEETSSAQLKIGSEQAGEEWFNRLRLSLKFHKDPSLIGRHIETYPKWLFYNMG